MVMLPENRKIMMDATSCSRPQMTITSRDTERGRAATRKYSSANSNAWLANVSHRPWIEFL